MCFAIRFVKMALTESYRVVDITPLKIMESQKPSSLYSVSTVDQVHTLIITLMITQYR